MRTRTLYILTAALAAALAVSLLAGTMGLGRAEERPQETHYPDQRAAARAAAWWLASTHQNEDGGYTSFSAGAGLAPSDVGGTVDAIMALASAGYPAGAPFPGRAASPLDYLNSHPAELATYAGGSGGSAAKLVQALVAAGVDPYNFAGHNIVISLTQHLSTSGAYGGTPYAQALALQAFAAVGEQVPVTATGWLTAEQLASGAWGDGFGTADNADATAMAVMALVATGVNTDTPTLENARLFLQNSQLPSAGWEYGPGLGESANSTALVLQALSALGEDFFGESGPWAKNGVTPVDALLGWQAPSGAFQVDDSGLVADFYATVQSLPAVTGWPYPLPGRYEAAREAVACLDELQDPVTGGWSQFAGTPPNAAGTSRAIQAIVAFGGDPSDPRWTTVTGTTSVMALEELTPQFLEEGRGGRVGVVMQGVAAAGEPSSVTNFAGYNLPVSVTGYLSGGLYADVGFGPFPHGEAMLGLLEAGYPVDPSAVQWTLANHVGGDWGEPDDDGILVNVLGRLGLVPIEAIAHLAGSQRADAAWSPSWDNSANANSTSEVVQGLVSAGYNPFDPAWSRIVDGRIRNAAQTIMKQQSADGCWDPFGFGPDPFASTDAVLLLMQEPGWYVERILLPTISN